MKRRGGGGGGGGWRSRNWLRQHRNQFAEDHENVTDERP